MSEPAPCQCLKCHKYVARDRDPQDDSWDGSCCTECGGGLPLAKLRAALADPLSVELVGLMTEECGEVSQRIGKILRWGWDADFEGTTQQHKLETELGDVLATILVLIHNGLLTPRGVQIAAARKIAKLQEDARGPRQRLQVAELPEGDFGVHLGLTCLPVSQENQ